MTCGLVHASYSLPEWQAVKLTFFAPCIFFLLMCNDIISAVKEITHQEKIVEKYDCFECSRYGCT